MLGLTRWTLLITAVLVSAILVGITVGIAQNPSQPAAAPPGPAAPSPASPRPLTELPLPAIPLPASPAVVAPEPATLERIRDILQHGKRVTETGDVETDDLADILGGIGSVLDGSPLDSAFDDDARTQISAESERALAAELLLKTARKLEQIAPANPSRRQLVIQMRGEAVKLLSQ